MNRGSTKNDAPNMIRRIIHEQHVSNLEKAKEFHQKNDEITASLDYAIKIIAQKKMEVTK